MKIPPPDIPGVRFRSVPRHSLYMVSDDNKVWLARRYCWREMKPHTGPNGEVIVWLMNDNNAGGKDVVVQELVQHIFGVNDAKVSR